MSPIRRSFAGKDELALALADAVATDLKAAVAARGAGTLAVSGGSTPSRFFAELGRRIDVEWSRVTITLVDERWVDEGSERSNARLVREKLLSGVAAAARFVPLYQGGEVPTAASVAQASAAIAALGPLDAVVLGMGSDGHTASFFPGGDTLDQALTAEDSVVDIRAPGAGEPRVTLTLARILAAQSLYLHIEGDEKLRVLDAALAPGAASDMPVRAVLHQDSKPVTIFWCP